MRKSNDVCPAPRSEVASPREIAALLPPRSGWLGALSVAALFAVAAFVTNKTVFPAFAVPTYSAVAGLGAVLICCCKREHRWAWFAAVGGGVFVTRVIAGLPLVSNLIAAPELALEGMLLRVLLERAGLDAPALSFQHGRSLARVLALATVACAVCGLLFGLGVAALERAPAVGILRLSAARAGADLTGILTIAPLASVLCERQRLRRRELIDLIAWCAALLVATHLGFGGSARYLVHPYLPLATLLFAVVRCGRLAAAVLLVLWAPTTIWYTQQGFGPWAHSHAAPIAQLFSVQLFNLTAFAAVWLVAGVLAQRDAARAALEQSNVELEARVAERTSAMAETITRLHAETLQRMHAEASFRELFSNAANTMLLVDPTSGQIVDANSAAAEYYGWSIEALRARNIRDINRLPADLLKQKIELARGLTRNRFEFEHVRAAGDVRDVAVYSSPITLDGRALLYSIVHDITEAKESERALRESEDRFRMAFHRAPVGMVEVSFDPQDVGRYLEVNQAFCRMVGYRAEELLARRVTDITHPEDLAADIKAYAAAQAATSSWFQFEKRYIHKLGHVVWASVNGSVLLDRRGKRYGLEHIEDITERKAAAAELAHRALHDPLTGLPNRQLFLDRLGQAVRKLERQPSMVALCYVDLDHFKEVNDTYGHEAGDQILIETARRLGACVRTVDTVARLAGDEFVIVCPDLKQRDNVTPLAQRIVAALSEPFELHGQRLELGASVGVSITCSAASSPDQLLREADTALYEVKRNGRNDWQLYSAELQHQGAPRGHDSAAAAPNAKSQPRVHMLADRGKQRAHPAEVEEVIDSRQDLECHVGLLR